MTDSLGHTEMCCIGTCLQDDPDQLVRRRLFATDWEGTWCEHHDPLQNPHAARHLVPVRE